MEGLKRYQLKIDPKFPVVTGSLYELGNKFTEAHYSSITNESYFMMRVFTHQSELSLSLIIDKISLIYKTL